MYKLSFRACQLVMYLALTPQLTYMWVQCGNISLEIRNIFTYLSHFVYVSLCEYTGYHMPYLSVFSFDSTLIKLAIFSIQMSVNWLEKSQSNAFSLYRRTNKRTISGTNKYTWGNVVDSIIVSSAIRDERFEGTPSICHTNTFIFVCVVGNQTRKYSNFSVMSVQLRYFSKDFEC